MDNPFDQFDAPQQGPVFGPPPKVEMPKPQAKVVQDGYIIDPNTGSAVPVAGLPPKALKGGSEDDVKLQQKRASLQSLEQQINRVQELYDNGLKNEAFGFLSSLGEYLPTPQNRQFDSASAGLAEQGLSAFRVPGVGAQSDTELRQFVEANRPSSSDYDATIEEKLRQLRTRVDATRAEMGLPPAKWIGAETPPTAPVDGLPSPAPGAAPEYLDQSRNLAELNSAPVDQLARSTNGLKTVDNPALKGVRGEYLRRLEAGQSPGEIVQFLRSAGITDPRVLSTAAQQADYRRKNPNVPIGNYNTSALDDMDVPLSGTESMLNDAAQTGGGAYLMNAGQAASFSTLDEIVGMTGGNAERVNIALEDSRRSNPVASLAGGISGSVMGAMGGELGLAKAGLQAGLKRSALADIAYGAGSGAGAADSGERIQGAINGAVTSGAGSVGGTLVTKGIGATISPTGGRLADLYEAGVRPTPGQRASAAGGGEGLSGMAGRIVGTTEEAIGSIPIVGAGIRGARQEARNQFQLGAYNEALKEVGKELPKGMKPGTAPYAFTKQVFNEAYDKARAGMRVAADEQLASEIGELSGEVANLAIPSAKRFEQIIRNTLMRRTGDIIDGDNFKKIQSELGKTIRGIRRNQSGDGELADALEGLQGILDRAARRHSAPEAVAALDAADAGYAKFVRIRDAAKARGGPAGEFSPSQFDSAVQRNTAGKYSDAYLRGDALMQDYAQQGMSLVDRLPNSGSADRIMTGTAATGAASAAGYVEPTTLGVLGILGTLYAPGVRKITTGTMAPRGKAATAVADAVKKRARIAGAVGAGAALSAQKDDGQ